MNKTTVLILGTAFAALFAEAEPRLLRGFQVRCCGNSRLPLPVEGEDLGVHVKDYRRVTR